MEYTHTQAETDVIRIILVDDHPMVRDGLRGGLGSVPGFQIIGEAGGGEEGAALAERLRPDVALVDISLKDKEFGGIRLTARLRELSPGTKIVILTMHDDSEYVISAMRAGAHGYVLKDAGLPEIIAAIDAVTKGGAYYSASIARLLIHEPAVEQTLTQREHEVLVLLAKGYSNKRIAQELDVGVRTVETHRLNLRRKLDIDTPAGLVKYAIDKGWI